MRSRSCSTRQRLILSAPHSDGASRTLTVGFQPHGPADAEAVAGKLFIHEDDTRTCLCALEPSCVHDPFWIAHNLSDSGRVHSP